MSNPIRVARAATFCALLGLFSTPAYSRGDTPAAPAAPYAPGCLEASCGCHYEPSCWSIRIMPFGWAPSFNGDLTVRGVTTPVDVTIGKTWDLITQDLSFLALGQVEATQGNYTLLFNGNYVNIDPGKRIRRLDFTDDLALTVIDLAATYNCEAGAQYLPDGSRVEGLLGVRYYALSSTLTVTGPRGNTASAGGTREWYDLIVGARARIPVCERLSLLVRGDVGGFDLGDSSRFSWNVELGAEYCTSERCSLYAGWRWLDTDYVNGSGRQEFAFDMLISGPVAGIVLKF